MMDPYSRRRFLTLIPAAIPALAAVLRRDSGWGAGIAGRLGGMSATATAGTPTRTRAGGIHPDPRPGIDGRDVLTAAELTDTPEVIPLFDQIREIPQIVDGLHCYCGCADLDGYRSLLSCYEGEAMARHCMVCQGQGRLAYHRWKEGQSLEQIRRAIDARFGAGDGSPPISSHAHAPYRATSATRPRAIGPG